MTGRIQDQASEAPAAGSRSRSRPRTSGVAPHPTRGRAQPCLLVAVDGSAASTRLLVWALREAARRDATVLAVAVVADRADEDARSAARVLLDAQARHAVEEAGVRDACRTALLDPLVFDALAGTAAGGPDLVVVGGHRKAVLRRAVPRRRVARPGIRFGA